MSHNFFVLRIRQKMGLNCLILKNETFIVNFKLGASATTILVVRMEWQKVENSASQIPMT